MGLHITLKDQHKKFGSAIEKILFKTLSSFVVDNVEDRNRLQAILQSRNLFKRFHIIFQSPRDRYIIRAQADPTTLCIADAINVDEDLVFNVLVDQCRIDETLVAENEQAVDEKYTTILTLTNINIIIYNII